MLHQQILLHVLPNPTHQSRCEFLIFCCSEKVGMASILLNFLAAFLHYATLHVSMSSPVSYDRPLIFFVRGEVERKPSFYVD